MLKRNRVIREERQQRVMEQSVSIFCYHGQHEITNKVDKVVAVVRNPRDFT